MSLVSLKELLVTANKNNFAVGYFEAWDLYSLEAVALAAEKENSPIVLGFGGMTVNQEWINSFGIEPLGRYANELAKSLSVPAAVYLNEVYEIDHAKRGIKSGFNSVLLETSNLSYEENINTTRELVKFAHSNDAHVQGEVGHLPDFIEDNDSDKLTDPNKAKNFINLTNIDFLGVSIGNVHMFSKGNFAWVIDNEDETKLITTMKKASRLMIIGNTNKGDETTDHYSMMGFTKAYNSAKKSCS